MASAVSYGANSVRVPKTGELIAAHIRRKIVRGELAEGDNLPAESELMAQFDVSRPTLREAFRILEAESLIVIRRGSRGARVIAPDLAVAARAIGAVLQMNRATLADVYEARAVVEPAAAGMFAQRRTKRDVKALTDCVDELEAMLPGVTEGSVELDEWARLTQHFHELIVDGARNQTLSAQTRVLRDVVTMHLSYVMHHSLGGHPETGARALRRNVRSYRKLIELVEARDADAVIKHWKLHMEVAGQELLRDVGDTTILDLFQ